MRSLIRNGIIILFTLVISIWSIIPPEKKLRLGRDLRGGTSLVYSVQTKPGDPSNVVERVIDVLKKRIDPNGLSEIAMVKQGKDRIEITMPLPNRKVTALKAAYEAELNSLQGATLDESTFQRLMRTPATDRAAEIKRIAEGDSKREAALQDAATKYDASLAVRAEYDQSKAPLAAAEADLKTAKDTNAEKARIDELTAKVTELTTKKDDLEAKTAGASLAFDAAQKASMTAALTPGEVRRALSLSDEPRIITDSKTNQQTNVPSAQQSALKLLNDKYPDQKAKLASTLKAYEEFARERTRLDDPADLKRLLAGAGVLDFRITVDPNEHPQEGRLRDELHIRGPRNVQSTDARWYKINKLDTWFDSTDDLEAIKTRASAYFAQRRQLVAEEYEGEYYILCWDAPGSRLTKTEGDWAVSSAYPTTDSRTGLPAIGFEMNTRGAGLLNELTKAHVNKKMAVLLDDEVYTAPNLQSAIGKSGQITGSFDDRELNYIINVLAAGSLQAKLSPAPISESTLAPSLGADNLKKSLYTGIIAFSMVAGFMVVYYFGCGTIAVVALAFNFVLVLGIMALNNAAFTLPGIAGVVLTFGQAVDSNVLIYERMREEFHRGADLRNAVRLGFSRALSPIMDGNISNLIICAVLYFFGTQEIKGFAITLGVGTLTTLFTALVVSRFIFTVLIEYAGWSRASQLPMAFPIVQKALSPHVDWMKHRWGFLGALIVFLVAMAFITIHQGAGLLGTEFRGGTNVELQFKTDEKTGHSVTLKRSEVQDRLKALAAKGDDYGKILQESEVVPINPEKDNVTSDHFRITFGIYKDPKVVLNAITNQFADVMQARVALTFKDVQLEDSRAAPAHEIVSRTLGENVARPALREDVGTYMGGVAILLENIDPPVTKDSLVARLSEMRQHPEYAETLARPRELRVIEGSDAAVKSAVILVRDESVSFFSNPERWAREVRDVEWHLTRDSLTRPSQLASVETFSPAIAQTFKAQAIISTILSLLILTIYVWVRFGAGRWAIAATLPLFADVIGIVGLIAVAQLLYENPSTNAFARSVGLLPFKLDLPQIAAVLTIVGYSLNDKIIILDRIRENKGKTPYASYAVVNESINQTLSRTIITAGAHMLTTIVLYVAGGEAVRGFAYTFNLGVILGTYTSIVSTPLVWSHALDQSLRPPPPAFPPSSSPPGPGGSDPVLSAV